MNTIDTAKGREAIRLLTPDEPAMNWGKYISDHIIDWDVKDTVSDQQAAARLDAITNFRAKVDDLGPTSFPRKFQDLFKGQFKDTAKLKDENRQTVNKYQKPIALFAKHLKMAAIDGTTIVDVTAGTGTTVAVSRSSSPESAVGAAGTTGARAASPASSPRRSTFSSISGPGASQRDHDGVPTGQEVSERPQPRPRGGNRGLALTGLDALARLHSRLHDSGPARRGVALAAAWTVADALSVASVAAGAAWAPRIDAAAMSLQPSRVRHHPADVRAGDGAGWGAVDHLSDVDMVHLPAEMSIETAAPIEFQEAWAEAQRCVNERVVAAVEADDPVQLKQHVAAGPSGMRNEYLRCLVGEYAPASGPAAVRAMSEVASMYLQVGEAEQRATERAVVDNMKEAYVSVLALSQLGVGIPAADSIMLIHGVRLIAEKLGPRVVIVHTDLRNAYNEAWRRTIIQRHIDSSLLHPVIPALLASLSTDSYLIVDDRSAPLRSEDGVRQGAPLATTYFCVAIHPEVQQCDSTLEVNGAARCNAGDGFLVGLPEHVWPALHAFRTSVKVSVELEVRFDKMHAYIADMEAARREAPADIEWPELDGHHGIEVLNVPLGSAVQQYQQRVASTITSQP
eukprot:jgi/Tetstr1/435483/TSEL_024389.t1